MHRKGICSEFTTFGWVRNQRESARRFPRTNPIAVFIRAAGGRQYRLTKSCQYVDIKSCSRRRVIAFYCQQCCLENLLIRVAQSPCFHFSCMDAQTRNHVTSCMSMFEWSMKTRRNSNVKGIYISILANVFSPKARLQSYEAIEYEFSPASPEVC